MSRLTLITVVLCLAFALVGCDGSGGSNNAPPVITDFEIKPEKPTERDQIEVTAIVEDPDDDVLGYSWRTSAGEFLRPDGNPVVLTPDGGAQDYKLRVSVSDGEASVTDSTSFLVRIADPDL